MINANELRRGNWVKWDNADIFYQIESINENTGSEEDPIPLTPEILEKAGFVHKGGWMGKSFCIDIYDENVELVFEFMGNSICVYAADQRVKKIENPFLHQLQNLYFALTGEELPIEL